MIYFVQPQGEPFIKIGFTNNLRSRLKHLQLAHPRDLMLLSVIEGTQEYERQLHLKFSRVRGEWFRADQRLKDFVASLPQATGPTARLARMVRSELDAMTDTEREPYRRTWFDHSITTDRLAAARLGLGGNVKALLYHFGASGRDAKPEKMPEALARTIWFDPTIQTAALALEKMNSDPRYRGEWKQRTAYKAFGAHGRPPGARPKTLQTETNG